MLEGLMNYLLANAPLSVIILCTVAVLLWRHHEKEEARWLSVLESLAKGLEGMGRVHGEVVERQEGVEHRLEAVTEAVRELRGEIVAYRFGPARPPDKVARGARTASVGRG